MKKAKIIAFSGIDGSGKTTQIKNLEDHLLNLGFKVYVTKMIERDLTILYDLSEKYFNNKYQYGKLPIEISRAGIAFDFVSHYRNIERKLYEYDFILCDRHKLCFKAYGRAYGLDDPTWIDNILDLIDEADYTLFFDVNPSISNMRLKDRVINPMREDEEIDHLIDVRNEYLKLLDKASNVIYIDANKSQDEVKEIIVSQLNTKLFKDEKS